MYDNIIKNLEIIINFISENKNNFSIENFNYVYDETKAFFSYANDNPNFKNICLANWNKTMHCKNWFDIQNLAHDYFYENIKLFSSDENLKFKFNGEFIKIFINYDLCPYKSPSQKEKEIICKYLDIFVKVKYEINNKLISKLFKHIEPKYEYFDLIKINEYIECELRFMIESIIKNSNTMKLLTKFCAEKNLITENIMKKFLCKNNSEFVATSLCENGYVFTEKDLEFFCCYCNHKSIALILNQKIKYSEKNVMSLFSNNNGQKKECVDVFVQFGYVVSKEVLIEMLKKNIFPDKKYIQDEYLQDEIFMKNVKNIIEERNLYPNEFGIKESPRTLEFIIKNKSKNLSEIKKFIKSKKITPSIGCLRNACLHKSNNSLIKYLIEEHKLTPDYECMKNSVDLIGNTQLSYIFDNYAK